MESVQASMQSFLRHEESIRPTRRDDAIVQGIFSRIYSNPYEIPQIGHIDLHVTMLAERRWAMIDGAWLEKSEVRPGETVAVKVLLRPYRGAAFTQDIPITIPAQASRGVLQLMVSDAALD